MPKWTKRSPPLQLVKGRLHRGCLVQEKRCHQGVHLGGQPEQGPGAGLWIVRVKISQEVSVRKVPQPAGIVRHVIVDTGEMSDPMMRPLVSSEARGETKEPSPSLLRRGGSLEPPCHRRGVVASRVARFPRDWSRFAEDVLMKDGALEFQIRIGEGPVRVGIRNHLIPDGLLVRLPPDHGAAVMQKPNAAATVFGGVAGANVNVDSRDEFLQGRRTVPVAEEEVAKEV